MHSQINISASSFDFFLSFPNLQTHRLNPQDLGSLKSALKVNECCQTRTDHCLSLTAVDWSEVKKGLFVLCLCRKNKRQKETSDMQRQIWPGFTSDAEKSFFILCKWKECFYTPRPHNKCSSHFQKTRISQARMTNLMWKTRGQRMLPIFWLFLCQVHVSLLIWKPAALSSSLPAVCQLTTTSTKTRVSILCRPGRCNALQSLLTFLCWVFSYGFLQDEITSCRLSQVCNLFKYLTLVVFIFSSAKDKVKHFIKSKKDINAKGWEKKSKLSV